MLELHAWEHARAVLRGGGSGNRASLPDCLAKQSSMTRMSRTVCPVQFSRPGRPTQTMVLRIGTHDLIEETQEIFREFFDAIVLATVPERGFASFAKTLHNAIHRRVMDRPHLFDGAGAPPIPDID